MNLRFEIISLLASKKSISRQSLADPTAALEAWVIIIKSSANIKWLKLTLKFISKLGTMLRPKAWYGSEGLKDSEKQAKINRGE